MKRLNSFFKTITVTIWLVVITFNSDAQSKDYVAVKEAVDRFVLAFNALNWEPFRNSFADDASVFFPEWEWRFRKVGKDSIEKSWIDIFPEFLDPNDTLKLNINPKNVLIQMYKNTAIVSFHLGTGYNYLARRTLIMVKKRKEWKIVHLHASYLFDSEIK